MNDSVGQEDQAWVEYRQKFSELYDKSNYESRLQSWAMHESHKLIEKKYGLDVHFKEVLEVGAGTGEHAQFVRHSFDNYILSDQDPRTLAVAKNKLTPIKGKPFGFETQTGNRLGYPDDKFDRLVATHVLEHIHEPHLALKEWKRVIKNGGVLSILIPTDPGVLWRFGRHLGPRRNALKQGIAYDYIMAREHVNSCNNLIALLRHYFPVSEESWWPLAVPSIDANLFFAFHATVDKNLV